MAGIFSLNCKNVSENIVNKNPDNAASLGIRTLNSNSADGSGLLLLTDLWCSPIARNTSSIASDEMLLQNFIQLSTLSTFRKHLGRMPIPTIITEEKKIIGLANGRDSLFR